MLSITWIKTMFSEQVYCYVQCLSYFNNRMTILPSLFTVSLIACSQLEFYAPHALPYHFKNFVSCHMCMSACWITVMVHLVHHH